METAAEPKQLQSEIVNLFQYIRRFREEIAQINAGGADGDHFQSMSDQLDAIVKATEVATNGILENLEGIEGLVDSLRQEVGNGKAGELCNQITDRAMQAMESCTFQDITGQRVTKIVRSMQFVEERVSSMIDLMGKDVVDEMGLQIREDQGEPEGEEALLNGPQLEGQAISQDEIDALFD
ncbi:MAG: hypothetical protein QF654_11045 [Alphaproteobacteria bacterium]|jgi:chemotaxis protein CheZ|nr:hypothetical protein [Alphaproteobacteria bacterium]